MEKNEQPRPGGNRSYEANGADLAPGQDRYQQELMHRQAPPDPIKELFRMVKAMLWSTAFITFLGMIIFSLIIVVAMTPEIQDWITTPQPSAGDPSETLLPQEYIFIIFPFPVLLFTISGPGFQAWHLLMLAILICAFGYSKYELWKEWLSRKGQAMLSLLVPEKANSSLEGVAKLFMATSFFSTLYFIFLELGNIEMESPPFDQFSRPELIYGLFNAAVFEELISRVLLIGVPLVLIAMALKWKKPLRKALGGGLDITPMTLSLIIFSATFFALAHVGSWDLWKVPQVLITGLALGYAFVRWGLHASIMIHFSINLSTAAMEIWPDNIVLTGVLGMAFLIWIIAGCYFFFEYIWKFLVKFGLIKSEGAPVPGIQAPPPAQYHPGVPEGARVSYDPPPPEHPPQPVKQEFSKGFICPNCGHTGANYDNGALRCMRCGSAYGEEKQEEPEDPDKKQFEY